jgi:CheY-like chemotaxis protein
VSLTTWIRRVLTVRWTPPPPSAGPCVVIAVESNLQRAVFLEALQAHGYWTLTATTTSDVLDCLHADVAAVLIDAELAPLGAFATLAHARRVGDRRPFVVLSSDAPPLRRRLQGLEPVCVCEASTRPDDVLRALRTMHVAPPRVAIR